MGNSAITFALGPVILLAGLILILGSSGLIMWFWPARKPPASTGELRCRSCQYNVAGLTHFHCPECGRDLREVGIDVYYDGISKVQRSVAALAWIILLPLSLIGLLVLLLAVM